MNSKPIRLLSLLLASLLALCLTGVDPALAGGQCPAFEAPSASRVDSVRAAPALGEYAVAAVELTPDSGFRVVVDARARWVTRSFERLLGKPVQQANARDLRAFLDQLADPLFQERCRAS